MIIYTSIALLIVFSNVHCTPLEIFYGRSVPLKGEIFSLRWATSGTRPQDFIQFELTVATRGWVAVGISKNGGMAGADMAIYQPDTNDLQDFHSTANAMPIVDQHQDYQLISVNRNDSHTILVIRRKLRTFDPDDLDILNGTTKVIWAYGDQPKLQYHQGGNRDVRNLLLLSPDSEIDSDQILANTDPIDIRMTNVSIPADKHTWYWCKILELPKFNQTNYLLGYEAIIQANNFKHVHHIVVYHCTEDVSDKVGVEGECYEDPKSPVLGLCTSRWLTVWAKGEGKTIYPKDFGVPIQPYASRQVRLEVHYDNSAGSNDLHPDNSGVKLYFTPKPQKTEVGSMLIRVVTSTESLIVPPKLPFFTLYSFCTADCTKGLPPTGIKVISAFFHAHLLGTAFKVRHIRNGIELPLISGDDNYDPDYQQRRVLTEPVTILPGDVVLMECSFNSVNGSHGNQHRTKATLGGFATTDEMCSGRLEYYPRVDGFSDCFVSITPETMANALRTRLLDSGTPLIKPGKAKVESPIGNRSVLIGQFTQEYDWTTDERKILATFQQITKDGKYHLKCGGVGKNMSNGHWVEVDMPIKFPNISAPFPTVEWRDSNSCEYQPILHANSAAKSFYSTSFVLIVFSTLLTLLLLKST